MFTRQFSSLLWSLAILFFSYQFLQIILPYTSWEWDIDFLLTKQHIIHLDYYRAAFYAHIFSSLFVLASGVVLFSRYMLHKWPKMHRYAGQIYVGLLLLVSAPSGFVMGFHANGGWAAQASFFVLTPLWWWFTWQGFRTAQKRAFAQHKSWMMRSYALTLSAVSLRVYQVLLGSFTDLDPVTQYVLVSWLAWLGNLAVAEVLIYRRAKTQQPRAFHRSTFVSQA